MSDFTVFFIDDEHFDYDIDFTKTESFKQKMILFLNTWKNEFVYDDSKGVDYKAIFDKEIEQKNIETYLLNLFKKQIDDFQTFQDFSFTLDKESGDASISFKAYSKDEVVSIEDFIL